MLLERIERADSTRYVIWTVTSARKLVNGDVRANLLRGDSTFEMKASATFKGGELPKDWKPFSLSQADLMLVWKGRDDG